MDTNATHPISENPGDNSSSKVTDEIVREALRECYDPEIPVNIVDLGLIYNIDIDDSIEGETNVFVKMTLTAPGCGMGPMIAQDARSKILKIPGVKNARVDMVFDPIWNPSMMTEEARLALGI